MRNESARNVWHENGDQREYWNRFLLLYYSKKERSNPPTDYLQINKMFLKKQKIVINAKVLKDTDIFIYEDYCKDTMSVR